MSAGEAGIKVDIDDGVRAGQSQKPAKVDPTEVTVDIPERVQATADADAQNVAKNVRSGAKSAASAVEETGKEAASAADETAERAASAMEDTAEAAASVVEETGEVAADAAAEVQKDVRELGEAVQADASRTGAAVSDAADSVGTTASEVVDSVSMEARSVQSEVGDILSEVANVGDALASDLSKAANDMMTRNLEATERIEQQRTSSQTQIADEDITAVPDDATLNSLQELKMKIIVAVSSLDRGLATNVSVENVYLLTSL